MIRLPETGPEVGRCVCGVVIREDSFRDKKSEKEWFLSSLCMECQDRVFLVPPQEVGAVRHTVRFGVLAAHRRSGLQILEVALLPFRFIPVSSHYRRVGAEVHPSYRSGTPAHAAGRA